MVDALARCRSIATSTWSDALDRFLLPGVIAGLTWRAGRERFAGRAVTIAEESMALGEAPLADFAVGEAILAASRGEVLVFAIDGAEISTFGGLAATAAARRGIEGVVIDGGCRDVEEMQQSGLGVVSRSVTPTSGKARIRVSAVNVAVRVRGVTVSPGDYVIADQTGLVVVAAADFDRVFELAQELDDRDRRFRDALEAGREFGAIAADLAHL